MGNRKYVREFSGKKKMLSIVEIIKESVGRLNCALDAEKKKKKKKRPKDS